MERTAFPLKVSSDKRYLVDGNDIPFMIWGDSPHTMITNLSLDEAAMYLDNRQRYGVSALWVNLLCSFSTACNQDAKTFDGISPFNIKGDLSSPNPDYFARAEHMIELAAARGMVVLLDPIETTSWLGILRVNRPEKAFAYGQYLGERFRSSSNIIWLHGNDFQSWRNPADAAVVQAVARGIRDRAPAHLHTVELNYYTSGSMDDPTWIPLIDVNCAYTYFPTYAQVLTEYNRPNFMPVIMVEANYEFEHNPGTDGGSTQNLRRQHYWTALSGAAGQFYGSAYTWKTDKGWDAHLDTPGIAQFGYLRRLLAHRKWYELVPDQSHQVVTAGYDAVAEFAGKLAAFVGDRRETFLPPWRIAAWLNRRTHLDNVTNNTFAPAAGTTDGTLVLVYLPTSRTITVDMSKLSGPVTARWYDPTDDTYIPASALPLENAGSKLFTSPGHNGARDDDWVLVLETVR